MGFGMTLFAIGMLLAVALAIVLPVVAGRTRQLRR
jgi:hypothetical protein